MTLSYQKQKQQEKQTNEIFNSVVQAQQHKRLQLFRQQHEQQQQQQRYLKRRQRRSCSCSILSNDKIIQNKYSMLLQWILLNFVLFLSSSVVVRTVSVSASSNTPWNLDQQQHYISSSIRRPRSSSSSSSSTDNNYGNNNNNNNNYQYDRSISTFNPEGRLLQVEYSIAATERASSMSTSYDGIIVVGAIAFIVRSHLYVSIVRKRIGNNNNNGSSIHTKEKSTDSTRAKNSSQKDEEDSRSGTSSDNGYDNDSLISISSPSILHRISETIWMITTGLVGDCLYLVQKVRQKYQEHKLVFGECMTVKEAAEYIANHIQHKLTIQSGSRPLASTILLFGYDNNDQNDNDEIDVYTDPIQGQEPSIYRIYPGGSMERCSYGTVGGGFRTSRTGKYNDDCLMDRFHQEKYNDIIHIQEKEEEESTIIRTDKDEPKNHRYRRMIATISCLLETIQDVCIENQILDKSMNDQLIQDIWIFSSPLSRSHNNVLCFHNIHDTKDSINAIERYLLQQP